MSGTGTIATASVLQPSAAGDIVGVTLQNATASDMAASYATFGEVFADGAVPAGSALVATIGGVATPIQMDAKTFYADGSVETAVLTMAQPALAAGAEAQAMLSLGGTTPDAAPLSLAGLTDADYDVQIGIATQNPDGSTTTQNFDAASLLQQALASGSVSYWLQGPEAVQGRVTVPLGGSLALVLDITRYANGAMSTDVQFDNDQVGASGGDATYSATISQDGAVVSQVSDLTQPEYTTWHAVVSDPGVSSANVVHDVAYLEATGAIATYDLSTGVADASLAAEQSAVAAPGWDAPLAANGLTQYMPTTGGRADIGPTTEGNTIWLLTQSPVAAQYATAQADAAGSIPWHFTDPTTGQTLTLADNPTLWVDPRGGSAYGTTGLPQPVPSDTGWAADTAHTPDLAYDAYLLTGSRYDLDQLNAEASFAELDTWPDASARNGGQGIVVSAAQQVRAEAWSLRAIDEAAYANPTGSTLQAYFASLEANNFAYLLENIPAWTAQEGQAYGYVPGVYGSTLGVIAPWQQGYLAIVVAEAAEQGNAQAAQVLAWMSHFLAGSWLNAAQGFDPHDAIAYNLTVGDASGTPYQSWAQIEAATTEAGGSNGTGWSQSQGDYGQIDRAALASIITVTEDPTAIKAYAVLTADQPPQIDQASLAANPIFNVIPQSKEGVLFCKKEPKNFIRRPR